MYRAAYKREYETIMRNNYLRCTYVLTLTRTYVLTVTGWKPLHIAVFETKTEDKVIPVNQKEDKNKEERKEKGKEEEEEGSRRNPDGTMRGVLVAVCPLYVKYNRYTVDPVHYASLGLLL